MNYWIGRAIGPKVFDTNIPVLERFLDRAALQKTHNFYEKHGGKTIVIARFVPVVRTFAPFVAGVSSMSHTRFQFFNILGALIWVLLMSNLMALLLQSLSARLGIVRGRDLAQANRDLQKGQKLSEMKGQDVWERGRYIEKQSWAIMPGDEKSESGVADACAKQLSKRS